MLQLEYRSLSCKICYIDEFKELFDLRIRKSQPLNISCPEGL